MSFFSRTSLSGTLSESIQGGQQTADAKHINSSMAPNVNLVLDSFDRLTGTIFSDLGVQPINNFVLAPSRNILQGQFDSLKVQEVTIPFSIPNIVANRTNQFAFTTSEVAGTNYLITVPEGFYTGAQLATEINTQITNIIDALLTDRPVFTYTKNGLFLASCTVYNLALYPVVNGITLTSGTAGNVGVNTCTLLAIMGYLNAYYPYNLISRKTLLSGFAPLLYTNYIDICSDSLTQFQQSADVSTSLASKSNVICRVYIADETSTPTVDASGNPVYPGMVPFVIHRQFKNAKVMRWNGQNSVGSIDLQLFDQWAKPLECGIAGLTTFVNQASASYPTFSLGDFQITLSATQQ